METDKVTGLHLFCAVGLYIFTVEDGTLKNGNLLPTGKRLFLDSEFRVINQTLEPITCQKCQVCLGIPIALYPLNLYSLCYTLRSAFQIVGQKKTLTRQHVLVSPLSKFAMEI